MQVCVCIIKIQVPHEVKDQRAIAIKEDFPNNEIWTCFNNSKWTDVKYSNGK